MKQISHLYHRISALRGNKGFTMIELLIVIAILGILAVAVLSAINPLEQINRGRDTSKQSDAEQLLNAIERFNAFQGHFPWDADPTVTPTGVSTMQLVTNGVAGTGDPPIGGVSAWLLPVPIVGNTECTVIDRLGSGDATGTVEGSTTTYSSTCRIGANELKPSYIDRVANLGPARGLYVYKRTGDQSSDIYICFSPQSSAFAQAASTRCDGDLPGDFPADACDDDATPEGIPMVCLP